MVFHLTKLHLGIFCNKFSQNWLCGSGEVDVKNFCYFAFKGVTFYLEKQNLNILYPIYKNATDSGEDL